MKKILLAIIVLVSFLLAQEFVPNYDEAKVPKYTLPPLLKSNDGKTIKDSAQWTQKRRNEILNLFKEHVYGISPQAPEEPLDFQIQSIVPNALDGIATRKQVTIYFTKDHTGPQMDVLIYIPKNVPEPVPGFLTLNFYGNHSIHHDKGILLADSWLRNNEDYNIAENKATEESRGVRSHRWAVEKIIKSGYALATVYYGDIDPDKNDFSDGIHPLFYKDGQTKPEANEWGSIAAWSWGLSRVMDYFENDDSINHEKIAVMGHSRLGKTALWAGVMDERFAAVISNNSGCGGAAISRRQFGETVERINTSFPHWFCDNFEKYNKKENELPVDQHMLLALVAPRPLYVASAEDDRWADPHGEFLSLKNALPVYQLFYPKIDMDIKMPKVNEPINGVVNYHIRTGKHDVTDYDWENYIKFADKFLK